MLCGATCSCNSYYSAVYSVNSVPCICNSVVVAGICVLVVVHCARVFSGPLGAELR